MSIQTSCLSRKIPIGNRTAYLRPVTVRQAVELLHVLKHQQDADDVQLLFELIGGLDWVGGIDVVIHLRNLMAADPAEFAEFMQKILLQGYDPEEQTKKSKKEDQQDNEESINWKLLISEYCRAYPGKDAFDVYDQTPFPFFMEMLPEARRETARRKIYHALEVGAGFGGGKKTFEKWQKEAGWKTKTKAEEYGEELSEEQKQKNRQGLKQRLQ